MKLFTALFLLVFQYSHTYSQNIVNSILNRVSQTLNSYRNIQYDITRELNYPSENYHNISKWMAYFDFQSTDTITGFKFQIEDSSSKQVFNGSEKIDLDKKTKTIKIKEHPDKRSFIYLSPFYNSIITLKNVLPLLLTDTTVTKTIADTTINNKIYHLITINTGKRRIQYLGKGFDAMTTKSNFIYKIVIRKDNHLPIEVLQMNDINKDYIKTGFTNIEINSKGPSELSWYSSTYTNDYKPAKPRPKLISKGAIAPVWKLDEYNNDRSLSLDELKGKVILLDFWLKNCGPCIQSVPHLNELQEKYKDREFKIVSINAADSKEDIHWFCARYNTKYTVLINGKEITEKYGVTGFPTFIIIDKEGKVIYVNEGYDKSAQSAIEDVIEKAL